MHGDSRAANNRRGKLALGAMDGDDAVAKECWAVAIGQLRKLGGAVERPGIPWVRVSGKSNRGNQGGAHLQSNMRIISKERPTDNGVPGVLPFG